MTTSTRLIRILVAFLLVTLPFLVVATARVVYQTTGAYHILFRGKTELPVLIYALIGVIGLLAATTSLSLPALLYIHQTWEKIGDSRRALRELLDYRKRRRKGLLDRLY